MRRRAERRGRAWRGAQLALALLVAAAAAAASPGPTPLRGWSRPTPPGIAVGVGYLTIDGGASADRLTGARSPRAARVEFHESSVAGGIARMRERAAIDIPAGGHVVFGPNGLHLMLLGLTQPLLAGERVPLTLEFEHAGPRALELLVGDGEPPVAAPAHARSRRCASSRSRRT